MALKSKFTCPYCFEEIKLKDVEFKCTFQKCKTTGTSENYFPAGSKNNLSSYPVSGVCPECGHASYKVVCPNPDCHNPLPESTLTGNDMIISIVGGTGTGKSCFVGVIIKELIERVAPRFGGAMIGFDDTTKRYKKDFESVLYGTEPKTLDRTLVNAEYKPLIYTLSLKRKGFLKSTIDSFTFVFFDTAGENLSDDSTMRTVNNYICKSAGIIFLLDPTNIAAVREQLSEDTLSGASVTDWTGVAGADDIMSRVSNMIREDRGLPSNKPIDVPVAAVFSKFDAIESIVPEGSIVLNPSPHCNNGSFVLSDAQNVDLEIKSLLQEWGEESFLAQVDVNYTTHAFFAASAFGLHNNPVGRDIQRPRPHRIEDAMLWLMMKNGAVPTSK